MLITQLALFAISLSCAGIALRVAKKKGAQPCRVGYSFASFFSVFTCCSFTWHR